MNLRTKIGLYVVLLLAAVVFAQRFWADYGRRTGAPVEQGTGDLEAVRLPDYQKPAASSTAGEADQTSRLGLYGFAFIGTVIVLGLMIGRDISQYLGSRTLKALFNDEGEGIADPEYDRAEEEWAKGNHLEAIRMMRDFLRKNPREVHASLRIAEIYEKDLQNFLAAALEYEEVLKQRISPERWGWAAVHLCNLYSSKLEQPDKGIAVLRRLVAEHPRTAAARKARKRLAEVDGVPYEEDAEHAEEPAGGGAEPAPGGADAAAVEDTGSPHLPPGFKARKS